MTITQASKTIWQLAGGSASRSFVDVFLNFGIGLVGPGDAGKWSPDRGDSQFDGPVVRRFADEVKVGDVIVLRSGKANVSAIGIVASDYLYLNQFDDVAGLDLQHARRVRWCKLPVDHTFPSQVFGANPPKCSRIWNPEITDYTLRFLNSPPTLWQTARLPELPKEEPPLESIPSHLESLVAEANDLVPLLTSPKSFGELPSEDELIAHFVIPFLRALGWPPEKIAVKWRYIDIALFKSLPRVPESCHLIIEAKRIGTGVEGALKQAMRYVDALGLPKDIVVTDGIRYRLYSCATDFEPVAYANLSRLKKSAVDLFERMKRA